MSWPACFCFLKLTRVHPRFVFTRLLVFVRVNKSRVEPGLVLALVEPGLVCAM